MCKLTTIYVLLYSKNGRKYIKRDEQKTNLIKFVIKQNISPYKIIGVQNYEFN